jgi:hypothetical protein
LEMPGIFCYFELQSALIMSNKIQDLEALQDIRKMMERSSRFISLSGWSGVAAGLAALVGAFFGKKEIDSYYAGYPNGENCPSCLKFNLMVIAGAVFTVALLGAFFFTYAKARKENIAVWGNASKRLLWNTLLPMGAGGLVIWRMMDLQQYELVAPVSLIFYGLALINGSKYTLGEVKYLGYAIILTGIAGLWMIGSGLYIWAFGFGILHIIYGFTMWMKYDRRDNA